MCGAPTTRDLVDAAHAVTEAAKAQIPLDPSRRSRSRLPLRHHPDRRRRCVLAASRRANICVFAAREVDRSPTGSGVTARIAVQHARGLIALGQERRFESVTGAIFTGKAVEKTRAGSFEAVTVEVGGKAHYTGRASFTLEEGDEIGKGFLLR